MRILNPLLVAVAIQTGAPLTEGQDREVAAREAHADSIWFGYALAALGDLDGDGAGDFLVGAPRESIRWTPERVEPRPSIRAVSGARGRVLFVSTAGEGFGSSIAVLGDLDGDGKPEFASGSSTSSAWICSGADGSIMREIQSPFPMLAKPVPTGSIVASPGDFDGDGSPDLIVSWHQVEDIGWVRGKVRSYSGVTGEELYGAWRIDGPKIERLFDLPDLNGDGARELGLAWPTAPATVKVLSSKDGKELFTLVPRRRSGTAKGLSLAAIGDLTGDGTPELAFGACDVVASELLEPGQTSSRPAGEVVIVSGRDGSTIRQLVEPKASPMFGRAVAGGTDFDGDAVPDYVVTEYEDRDRNVECGRLCFYSGKDHSLIREVYGRTFENLGASLALIGDVDRDGVSDAAVGCMYDYPGSYEPGRVLVLSGKTGKKLRFVPP